MSVDSHATKSRKSDHTGASSDSESNLKKNMLGSPYGNTKNERQPLIPNESHSNRKKKSSASHSQNKVSKDDMKTGSDWNQEDEPNNEERNDEVPLLTKICHGIMLCGLVTTPELIWRFPREVARSGGVYFIIIYFLTLLVIILPLLHMEIFIGQRCQSGLIKTMRNYGTAFECIGFMIFFLAFIRSLSGIPNGFMILRHLTNLFFVGEGVMRCSHSEEYYRKVFQPRITEKITLSQCVSLLDDYICQLKNSTLRYFDGCVVSDEQSMFLSKPVSEIYAEALRENHDVGAGELLSPTLRNVLLYGFCMHSLIAVIGAFGIRVIRLSLVLLYITSIIFFTLMTIPLARVGNNLGDGFRMLRIFTTPESIFNWKTYMVALNLCVTTTGLGYGGILCASSYRGKRENSFLMAYVMIVSNVLLCVISLFCGINLFSINIYNPRGKKSPVTEGQDFLIGMLNEVYFQKGGYLFWLWFFNISFFIVNVKSFFAPLIMLTAFIRDHFPHRRFVWNAGGVLIFAIASYLLNLARLVKHDSVDDYFDQVNYDVYISCVYVVIVLLVLVFVQLYGEREFLIDLCELYPLSEKQYPLITATDSSQFFIYEIAPFAFLIVQIYLISNKKDFTGKKIPNYMTYTQLISAAITVLVVSFGIRFVYEYVKKSNSVSKMFGVTPEHPSYKRINSGRKQEGKKKKERQT